MGSHTLIVFLVGALAGSVLTCAVEAIAYRIRSRGPCPCLVCAALRHESAMERLRQ